MRLHKRSVLFNTRYLYVSTQGNLMCNRDLAPENNFSFNLIIGTLIGWQVIYAPQHEKQWQQSTWWTIVEELVEGRLYRDGEG